MAFFLKKPEVASSSRSDFTTLVDLALKPEDVEMDSCISKISEK